MKKIAAMILVLFGLAVPGRAVTLAAKGIRAGLAIASWPKFSNNLHYGTRLGPVFGLFASFSVSRGFSIQPELLVIEKGAKGSFVSDGSTWKDSIRLTYLEIPVLARYYFPLSAKKTLHGYLGPAVSFRLRAVRRQEREGESVTEKMGNVPGVDYGFVLGECVEWRNGRKLLAVDIRYTIGLSLCLEKGPTNNMTVRNGALQVLIGYGF